MYSVVQFTNNDGGTISVVNSQWLTPRKCEVYWPPVKNSKTFERLLPSDSDKNWQLFGVQRVFYETDSLEKAKQKVKLAEVTSDLQTEEETEIQRPKRRVVRTNRYISSDEEDDNDIHIRPPPLKKQFVNVEAVILPQTEETRINIDKRSNNRSPIQTKYYNVSDAEDVSDKICLTREKFINSLTDESGPSTSTPKYRTTARENKRESTQDNSLLSLPTSLLQSEEFLTTSENPRLEKDNLKLTGYQEKVVSLLTLIKTQNDQILSILKQKKTGVILKPDFKFPLNEIEQLEATEEVLKNQVNYVNLVSYLETLGGRDTSDKVSRMMKTLLADCLAKKFNFYGRKSQKMPFCQLLLRKCIVESVKNVTSATEKEIEDFIKVWLKHAPERVLKKENRINS